MSERQPDEQPDENSSRLEELYERVLQRPPSERLAFLEEACGDDAQLQQELRSLLEHREAAETFFSGLASTVVSPTIGEQIHHYRLTGILGTGGMGTVYRAHDTRLERVVALKFLPPYLSANPESHERFLVEARAAAALEHPNVCSIHEIGETTDGRPFIAMACYEGETLKERLRRGPLPPTEALDIAMQLARGLGAAHARRIVHRDVKPGNIMLTADGTVRLLDFGVAKVSDMSLTSPGTTPGTIAYMSPEQARGETVSAATDLWSLGVVLYEMLAGARPFRGGNDRTVIQAILNDQPDLRYGPLRNASPSTLRIIERLLQKSPQDRFASAGALLQELTRRVPASGTGLALDWMRRHARPLAVSVAALLGLVALVSRVRPGSRSLTMVSAGNETARPAIAVLPFTVRGPGLDVWQEGMVDLLSLGLDGAGGLRAVDSRTLLATWHHEMGDGSTADLARALGVARRTNARYALVGSVVGSGPRIRLAGDVYDATSGQSVGPVQVDGPSDSVLALADRLGMQTLALVLEKDPNQVPTLNLAATTTPSLSALKAYLEGDEHYRRGEFPAASEAWERAVQADTVFALAYVGLADAYAWYAPFSTFEKNLIRAHQLAARLPERERTRVEMRWARYAQVPNALATMKEAVRRYPDAADAWYELGESYFHDASSMGSPAEIEASFRKAVELQPAMAPYRAHLLELAFNWQPDSTHIAAELGEYSRLAPGESRTRAGQLAFALAYGSAPERDRARAALGSLDAATGFALYNLLAHPRFAEIRATVFPAIKPRLNAGTQLFAFESLLLNLGFVDGHLRAALAVMADTTTPIAVRICGPIYFAERDMPVPRQALERGRAILQADTTLLRTAGFMRCAAEYAVWFGDWKEHAALVAAAQRQATSFTASGDSWLARRWQRSASIAEAFGLRKRGRTAEALKIFEEALPADGSDLYRWYPGLLALELGKLDEAERGFRALWGQRDAVPARLRLARLLEQQGRAGEALDEYRYIAFAWRHADPELQPVAEEARQAIERLSPVSQSARDTNSLSDAAATATTATRRTAQDFP